MIRKVIRGDNIGRTVNYLFGPGKHNEHTNPHLVAAWDPAWLTDPALTASLATAAGRRRLIAQLDAPRVLHGVEVPGGHVYHVPLSLPAEDGQLGDDRWRQVVEEAIDRLGFGPDRQGRGGCRWIAVHHGLSVNGNDHIHVVVQLVRGDGRIANLYRDWPKWDAVCQAAEARWNLTRTRPAGAGRRPLSRAEIERAHRTQRVPARRDLAHRVRAAAAAAGTEAAFPAELRRCGVLVEPRMSGSQVVGYRVALTSGGQDLLWLSGSQLARDLSLPRLRTRWEVRGPHWDRLVIRAWQQAREPRSIPKPPSHRDRSHWEAAQRALVNATDTIERLEPGDTAAWTQHVGHTADLVAVLSQRLDPNPARSTTPDTTSPPSTPPTRPNDASSTSPAPASPNIPT